MVVGQHMGVVVNPVVWPSPLRRALWPGFLRLAQWGLRMFTSAEWALMIALLALLTGFGMLAGWDGLQRDWREAWSSGALSWITLMLVPLAWMVGEVGRALMWARWHGRMPQWRLRWLGLVPMWLLDPADLARSRQRAQRLSVNLWGLLHALLLVAVAWVVSRLVSDAPMQHLGRAWFHAAVLALVVFQLNPFWDGAAKCWLQEWWHVPDLDGSSRRWWARSIMKQARRWSGLPAEHWPASQGETAVPALVVTYAPLGWLVHVLALIWLVTWLGVHHPTLALLLMWSAGWALGLRPLGMGFALAWRQLDPASGRWRMALLGLMVLGLGAYVAMVVPWPRSIVTQAVVTLPEDMVLRSPVDGRLTELVVVDGQSVFAGQALLAVRSLAVDAVDADADAMVEAPGQWGMRTLGSPGAGRVLLPRADGMRDRVVRKGQVLARLLPHSPPQLSWVVPARHAQALQQVRWIRARPIDQPQQQWQVMLSGLRAEPAARLPAQALSARHGGVIPVLDSDPQGLTPAEPMIALQAQLAAPVERIGGRVWVRMELPPQPLGWQLWTRLCELWQAAKLAA